MHNLKKGDLILLTRLSDTDSNVPKFLENVWGEFDTYTKTGKLEVLAPARAKLKDMKERRFFKKRIIHYKNVKAIVRKEKNPQLQFFDR